MVEPGRRCLGDRYELSQLIAAGGMGQVWRGCDVLLDRPVAVKVLRSEYTGDSTFLARFRAEAHHAASLSHPNIAAVFDYGEVVTEDGSGETLAFLVMELVDGEPLSTVLQREGRLDTPTTLSLLRQAAAALGEAHRVGMVHRDVKPGNLLVRRDGRVKITDFGIAWSAGSVPLTRTGQVIGTPQYLSPEQAEGHLATPASDVYALGLVGYECLVGRPAFDGDNAVTIALKQLREQPEPLPAELPAGVRALIGRALAKDPAARLADGSAFAAAIDAAVAGRALVPPPTVAAAAVAAGDTEPVAAMDDGAAMADGAPTRAVRAGAATRRPGATGPVRTPPTRRRLVRRIATVMVPVMALLVGAGVAALVLHGLTAADHSNRTVVAADTGSGTSYVLVADKYVGRPVDEVAIQLAALGLAVERRPVVTSVRPAGTVTAVDPVGVRLHPGDTVTLSYAVPPAQRGTVQPGTVAEVARSSEVASTEQPTGPSPDPATTVASSAATTAQPTPTTSAPASGSASGSESSSSGSPASSSSSAPPSSASSSSASSSSSDSPSSSSASPTSDSASG